jgi:dihydropteroate synthase
MPTPIRLLELDTLDSIERDLAQMGLEGPARERPAAEMHFLRIRMGGLHPPVAQILKQAATAAGGGATLAGGGGAGREVASDVILAGTLSQLRRLVCALEEPRLELAWLAERLGGFLADVARRAFTVKTRGGSLGFGSRTLVMAVLNVTPDSFSDGGQFLDPAAAVDEGNRLEAEGADILDVGGESTRPGSRPVDAAVELSRVIPVIERLAQAVSIPISIDTTKAAVAEAALRAGAAVVNVIGALDVDPEVADVAAREDAGLILTHMKGTPARMYEEASYPGGVMGEVVEKLGQAIALAVERGVDRERVIVDPGLGFGKRAAQSLEALRRLGELRSLGRPILVGPSRKSFIGDATGLPLPERLPGTAAACTIAVLKGAGMVRVHDVAPVLPALRMAEAVRDAAADE